MDVPRVTSTIARFFEQREIPFAVIGGLALHAYGLPRATFDADFAADAASQVALIAFLEALGYRTLHQSAGYSNHLHEDSAWGRVDMVYVRDATSRRLFSEVRHLELLPGLTAPVPRPEHLIAMKVQAMANDPERALQDLADIRHLAAVPGVDQAQVREAFAKRGLEERYDELRPKG